MHHYVYRDMALSTLDVLGMSSDTRRFHNGDSMRQSHLGCDFLPAWSADALIACGFTENPATFLFCPCFLACTLSNEFWVIETVTTLRPLGLDVSHVETAEKEDGWRWMTAISWKAIQIYPKLEVRHE